MKALEAKFYRDRKGFPVAGEYVRDHSNDIYEVVSIGSSEYSLLDASLIAFGTVAPASWDDMHIDEHVFPMELVR